MANGATLVFLIVLCSIVGRLHGWIPSYAYDQDGDPTPAAEDESGTHRASNPDAATPNLEAKFKGRCNDFLGPKKPAYHVAGSLTPKDCDNLWQKFLKGFQYSTEGKVTTAAYNDFFKAIESVVVPKDQTAFYSGGSVRTFFEQNTPDKTKLYNIERTFPGYVLNGLVFCGNPSTKTNGINTLCGPRHKSMAGSAWYSFWQRNSEEFAKKATGKAQVVLSSQFPQVYVPTTMFSKYEVKTLTTNTKVTSLELLLLRVKNDLASTESCSPIKGTIATLKTDAGPTLGKSFQCNYKPKALQPLVK